MKFRLEHCMTTGRFFLVMAVITVLLFGDFSWLPKPVANLVHEGFRTKTAEAAEVDIDTTLRPNGPTYINSGSQTVFVSDQVGYKFYQDFNGTCVYSKTTNGGTSWGATTTVDSQPDCLGISVWYDRWTPNDFGDLIHIVTMDVSLDDLFYNRLDTTSDTLLMGASPVDAVTNSGNSVATFATGTNYASITKGTDGTIYLAADDTSDSYVVECTTGCNLTTGWTETGTRPQDLANDYSILVPLTNGDIMLINRDISTEDIRHKIWRNAATAWDTAWTTIDHNATDNTTYDVGLAVTLASSTAAATTTVYLAYTADNATLGTDDDIRLGVYSNSSWSTTTPVLNDAKGLTGVAIAKDDTTGYLYLGYSGRTTPGTAGTGNVYWKVSTTTHTVWSSEFGPVNTAQNDIYGIDLNIRNSERIYASWFELTGTTISADTIANPTPGILVTATGSLTSIVRATSTNQYLGGTLALIEGKETRNITSVTITETGTIDASVGLDNIRLYYENDTTFPYDCASVSYGGTEEQYGATNTDSFSGPNGTSTFTETVSISTTSALCLYPVMDVTNEAIDQTTIDIDIANPPVDVVGTLSPTIAPTTTVSIASSTLVRDDEITLTGFHWRNDDGSEALATSSTGGVENTNYTTYPFNTRKRLRVQVSNEGSTTTLPQQYRLEYAVKTFICAQETLWIDVGAAGGDWDMSDSVHLTNGNNTTNIALGSLGAITDANTVFLGTGGQRDTTSQTGALTLGTTTFAEIEYSIIASTTATAGSAYCFRVTDSGTPLDYYTTYPQATIASDVLLSATGTQATTIDIGTNGAYLGGAFVLQKQTAGSLDIQSITITASGSVDYQNDLDNIVLKYDLDTSAPYDCASESYSPSDLQYGATTSSGFSATSSAWFNQTVSISQTQTMCVYTIFDVASTASNGELLDIQIETPQNDIVRSAGTLGPDNTLRILGNTELVTDIPTQSRYHFRNDDGSETTATSKTGGSENTNLTNFEKGTSTRLRIEVYNAGGTSTPSSQYRLEYAHKTAGSCSALTDWVDVGAANGDWDMQNSANLTDGNNTTNIAVATGGTTDDDTTFLSSNGGVKDTSSQTGSITLASTTFVELEYSIISSSTSAAENGTYCFRVSNAGTALKAYSVYPEVSLKNVRDFKVQRGNGVITGGTLTITAGVDYVAPSASTSAFIRITNSHHTGAGSTGAQGTQNSDDSTVYITNPWNIGTSITFQRQTTGPANNTRFAWEIVEYVGPVGGDNEFIVRQQQVMTYGTASTSASGTPVTGVVDNNDVAVFITGVWNPDTAATSYYSMLTTAVWSASTQRAGFNRGVTGTDAVRVSYAVIEFTGANWRVQRVEHTYSATGTVETEAITAVNSLSRAFIHAQKRVLSALNTHANYGHEVWLSSVGAVSFQLDDEATVPANHVSVAWVIENTQTKGSPMIVTRSSGTQTGGGAPLASSTLIGTTIDDVTESSIFANNRSTGTTTPTFPEPLMMFELISTSTTEYRLWVSNTGNTRTYRVEVVEWPAARRELTQNYYRLYVNEDALDPQDPWPQGGVDLGENTAMTGFNQPTSNGSQVRIRMSLNVSGQSSMPPNVDAFKLQYGKRTGASCSAITEWLDLGDASSTTAKWRAYDNASVADGTLLSTNPPAVNALNLSVSDRAGTYEESNNTAVTSFIARSGEDMEFDWSVMNNNADEKASYCFRMVESDDSLLDVYPASSYPIIRTVGYGAESYNWRWYDDAENETPTSPFAGETVTPIDITYDNAIALRITLRESNGAQGTDVKFKLQFSESPTFETATDVAGTSTCGQLSYWCYSTSTAGDNSVISSSTLTDAELCISGVGRGCGTHNASGTSATTYDQPATSSAEFSFIIRHAGARVNRTYYFRVFDVTNATSVPAAAGESYPSLTTEGATLTLTAESVGAGTTIDGVTTDVGTTPTSIPFGSFTGSTTKNAAYRFTVSTDATEGYQLFVFARQGLLSNKGDEIPYVSASNTSPAGWGTACATVVNGCFGYHAADDTLSGGSTRFAPNDTFAALETTPREVGQSSIPVVNEQVDVMYRVTSRLLQEAGEYTTTLVYLVVPVF